MLIADGGWDHGAAPPRAFADAYDAIAAEPLVVSAVAGPLANDLGGRDNPPELRLLTAPRFGHFQIESDGAFEYIAFPGFEGVDSFRYRAVSDGIESTPVTALLEVHASKALPLDLNTKPQTHKVAAIAGAPGEGQLSLLEALGLAKANGPSTDIIDLSNLLDTSFHETIVIDTNVVIRGAIGGSTLRMINGGSAIGIATGVSVELVDLRLLGHGDASGENAGIHSSGDLTLRRVHISDHLSTSSRGGGIYNAAGGKLTVIDTTISDNGAAQGGGIYNDVGGTLGLFQSTISGNTSSTVGGGLFNAGEAMILNSTLVDNLSIWASGIAAVGTTTIGDTIIAGSVSGGDVVGSFESLGGNLIGDADGSVGFSWVLDDQHGTAASPLDPNLSPLQLNGGIAPTHLPLPGSPAIDGGLVVRSHADARGAARWVDGLDPSSPLDDHRRIDIGAVEFGTFVVNVQDDANDTTPLGDGRVDVDAGQPGDQISLRAAIAEFNALAGITNDNSTVTNLFEASVLFDGVNDWSIALDIQGRDEDLATHGDLDLFGTIGIHSMLATPVIGSHEGQRRVTISGTAGWFNPHGQGNATAVVEDRDLRHSDRLIHLHPGATANLDSLTLRSGVALQGAGVPGGAGLLNDGATAYLSNMEFRENLGNFGSAIFSRDGLTYIERGSDIRNNLGSDGAGIYVQSGEVIVSGTSISENHFTRRGGGVFVQDGTFHLRESSEIVNQYFEKHWNHSQTVGEPVSEGHAIYQRGGEVWIDGSSVRSNHSNQTLHYQAEGLIHQPPGHGEGPFMMANAIHVSPDSFLQIIESELTDHSWTSDPHIYRPQFYPPIVISNSGTVRVERSLMTRNNRLLVNYQTGRAAFVDSVLTQNQAYGGHHDGSTQEINSPWEYRGERDYGSPVPQWDTQRYGQTRLIAASIQNHGGEVDFVRSEFTSNGAGEHGDAAQNSIVNVGVQARLRIIESNLSENATENFPVVLNHNGVLEIENSTFSRNVAEGYANRWVGAVQHFGHGQYVDSIDMLRPTVAGTPVIVDDGSNDYVIPIESASILDSIPPPARIRIGRQILQVQSVDVANASIRVSGAMRATFVPGRRCGNWNRPSPWTA